MPLRRRKGRGGGKKGSGRTSNQGQESGPPPAAAYTADPPASSANSASSRQKVARTKCTIPSADDIWTYAESVSRFRDQRHTVILSLDYKKLMNSFAGTYERLSESGVYTKGAGSISDYQSLSKMLSVHSYWDRLKGNEERLLLRLSTDYKLDEGCPEGILRFHIAFWITMTVRSKLHRAGIEYNIAFNYVSPDEFWKFMRLKYGKRVLQKHRGYNKEFVRLFQWIWMERFGQTLDTARRVEDWLIAPRRKKTRDVRA